MTRLDEYAATIAYAQRHGACLTGHDWWEATYTTVSVEIDPMFGAARLDRMPGQFVQERRCDRCGHRVTVVSALRGYWGEWVPGAWHPASTA